ncbi:MAG: dicarboxylate/amino acid:cation symporter [Gammaproteobacteria bacterium]|nr:dicarboxylate/amino acid:cation symporter [Gammaproteobacteria bacterium]MBT8135091.1 dicarboxylate/amino acid:cation symporter [Gammaproteobacteria bacterium]NNJ50487.1 dicarboxylate/amino acid:cation symporter [Gammaproteobacteria bacterium]
MTITKLALHWQILIALCLAVVSGLLLDQSSSIFGVSFLSIFVFFGTLFLNALKMLIVPLVMASIIVGMMGLHGDTIGRLGTKTILYYASTSLVAILIGLFFVNLLQPGIVDGVPARDIIGLSSETDEVVSRVGDKGAGDIAEVLLRMVPPNIVTAAANGQMLGLIFFSLIFGFFVSKLQGQAAQVHKDFWQGMLDIMMMMTHLIMKFAPIGVYALVAKVIMISGIDAFKPLAMFFVTVILALAVHLLLFLPAVLRYLARVSPGKHYKAMLPALLTAFSTSSSSATLPITMDCVENRAGVSNQVTGFTLPLGATINMDGTALYECVAAMFIAQAYGISLDVSTQFTIVLIALLTSIGVAGIPSASLVAITIILAAIGLPLEAIGLILVVDRVLDMCRTSVNVFSDSCAAVTIARLEGEKTRLV